MSLLGPIYAGNGAYDVSAAKDPAAQQALDFVLWLNGAMDVLSDTPPTQAQWDAIRGKVTDQIGAIVAQRIRKAAEPVMAMDEYRKVQQAQVAYSTSSDTDTTYKLFGVKKPEFY